MTSFSITRRLVVWLTVSTLAFWGIGVALGAYVMHSEFGEIFDSAMQQTAERLLPLVLDDINNDDLAAIPQRLQAPDTSDGYLTYQARDATGRVLMHSFETPPAPFKAPLVPGFWQDSDVRVFTAAAANDAVFVQVADSLPHRIEAMQDGGFALLVPVVALIPLSVVVLLLIIRRATAPLTDLRIAIAARDSANLSPLVVEGLPEELQPIANALNILLSRLGAALSAEREFTANSAHELRTPIAGALAQTQMLMSELGSSDAHRRARLIEQSLQRLGALTEKLLQLSRAEAGIGASDTPQDLGRVTAMVVEDFNRRLVHNPAIVLIVEDGATVAYSIDPDAFAIVVRNLIENAVVHGTPTTLVTVRIAVAGMIVVSNRSKLYTKSELETLRRRFARDDDLSPGSGLGLSIVERLLAQTGASLELRSRVENEEPIFEAIIRFG